MVLSSQVEGQVLRGLDDDVPQAAAFVALVLAAIDGRPLPDLDRVRSVRRTRATAKPAASRSTAKPAASRSTAKPAASRPTRAGPPKRG
jgi:BRCT domain type II-containing protein